MTDLFNRMFDAARAADTHAASIPQWIDDERNARRTKEEHDAI